MENKTEDKKPVVDKYTDYLYGVLKDNNAYDGDYNKFYNEFYQPGIKGYTYRKELYNTMTSHGIDLGASYEDFANWIGLHAIDPQTQQTPMGADSISKDMKPVEVTPTKKPEAKKDEKPEASTEAVSVNQPATDNTLQDFNPNVSRMRNAGTDYSLQAAEEISNNAYSKSLEELANQAAKDLKKKAYQKPKEDSYVRLNQTARYIPIRSLPKDADLDSVFEAAVNFETQVCGGAKEYTFAPLGGDIQERYEKWKALRGHGSNYTQETASMSPNAVYLQARNLQASGKERPAWISELRWNEALNFDKNKLIKITAELEQEDQKRRLKRSDGAYPNNVSLNGMYHANYTALMASDIYNNGTNKTIFVLFQDGRIRPLQAPDPSILRGGVEAQRELFRRQYEKMTFGEEGKDYTDPYEKNRVVGNFLQNGEVCHIIYFPYMIEQRRWDDAQELIKIGLGGKFNEKGVLLNPDDRLQILPVVVKNGESEEDAIAKAKVELDNEISKKLPYKETYLQQQIAQAREALKKEQERLKQLGDQDVVKRSYMGPLNPHFVDDIVAARNKDVRERSDEVALTRGNIDKYETAIEKYTQALKGLRTGDKAGFWKGFREGFSDLPNWTFGLYNLRENLVAVKAHEGKMGQEAKDRLGLARSLSQESMSAFHKYGASRSNGIGFGVGYSLPFTIQAIATYGAGNVAARGIIRGGSRMAAKYGTNWLFDTTIRATTRLAAINAAGVIDSSFQMPRIISDAAIEKMGLMNYTFDENQRIVVTGTQQEKSWGHSLLHSGLNTLVQNVSERVGTYVLEPVAKAFGIGKISLRSFGEALPYNKTIHMIQNGAFAKAMSKVYGTFEKGGYDGFVNEVLEEYIANPMTATFDENYTFADIFDSRQNLDTALSVWASSIFMLGFSSTASSVKYYRTLRSVNSAYDKAEANARRLFGNENWDKIQNTILRLEGEPLVNAIYAGVCQNKSLSDEQKKAFLNYVRAQKAQAVFNNAVSEKYSFSLTGEELNEMNAMTIHAYAEGRNMQTPQEYAQAQQAFADTREMAMSALGVTDDIDAYLDTLGETPAEQLKKGVEVAKENGLDEKAANAALSAYLNAREQQKGAMDGITSDESIRRQHADSVIRQITFENEADSEGGSGKVILVNVKGREKPVFLIRGRYENGSITGETVVVSEGNGVIEMIPASEVEGIVEESDAMTERQRKYDKIDAENKEQQRLINLNMDTPLAGQGGILMDEEGHRRQVGIKCVFNDEQGNPASVLVIDQENNDYLIPIDVFREQRGRGRKFEAIEPYLDETDEEYHAAEGPMNEEYNLANKEQEGVSEEDAQGAAEDVTPQPTTDATEKPTKPEVKYDYHVKMKDGSGNAVSGRVTNLSADGVEIEFDAPYNGKMVDRIPLADFDNGVSEIADADGNVLWNETEAVGDTEVAPQVDAAPTQVGQEDAEKPAIAQAEQEHKPTALERIPKDENGNPIYEQTDAETAFTGLTEEAGNVIEAEEIAKSMVEDKEKALEKAKKIKLPSGVSVAEKVKAAKVRTQAIAKAQEELDKWKAIAEVPAQQRAKVVEERIAKEKAEAEAKRKAEEEAKRANEEAESELNSTIENVLNTLYKKGKDYASKIFNMKFFDFANTPDFMKHLGMTGSKFTIRYGVIARHFGKDGSHDFTQSEWEQIPHAIEHPFAITQLKNKEKGFRIYTALKTEKGEYVVVGVDVKNAGRDMEVNAIATMFGRRSNANLSENEEVIYKSKEITPEQEALLSRPNSDQYPAERELSTDKVTESAPSTQENGPKNSTQSAIESASAEVETSPTEAQKKAGNYKMGHVKVGAFDVTIENPKGSERSGTDANGKKWSVKMNNTYGYIRGTEGVDGDHIDVFLAEDMDKWDGKYVFVVDQYNPDGTFDEHKVMLGFNSMEEARSAYLSNYENGWENGRRIDVTAVNLEDFEKWIGSSHRKTKPFAEYAGVKKETIGNAPAKEKATPTKAETKQTKTSESKGYTITPSTYTNKKGKTSDVSLLTFDHNLTADQERAVKEFAKERIGEGRFAPARGWKDRESGGWMFRSEEDARKAAEMVGNEEAVADNQPMTVQELRDAVEPKKPTASKKTAAKKPANRVEVADVAEQKPSEPTKAEQPKLDGEKKLVITDEMKHDEDILRELLGIGDEELDGGIKFRDPDAMTSQQRRFVYNAGVNYSLGYIDQGFVKFPEFAKAMVSRLGYKIKPWLKSFYEGAKRIPGYDQAMFTPTEEVDAFDVENFDKPHKDVVAQANMIVEEGKAQVAAEKANNELKATRNEQRKETEKQTAANTDAIGSKATSVASEVENLAETSSDRQELGGASERVDETLDKVNEQLALLGYYEAEEVEKDYNEAYGYMRNAEKKAVKDAANLASQLIDDLGLDRFEATHGKADKKGKRKTKPLAVANIAPLGGDVSMHLPLEEGRELYVNIQLVPSAGRGVAKFEGDNLEVTRIMFRVDNPNGNGNGRYDRRYGINIWVNKDVTYSELLDKVKREVYKYLPKRTEVSDGKYAAGDKVQYSTDGGRTWTDAVVAHPNDEGGYLIDTGLAPVLWVNAHPDQLRHKPESNTISDTELIKRITEHPLFKELVDNNPDAQAARTLLGERIMTDVRLSLRKDGYVETYKKLLNDKGFSEKIADKAFAKRHIVSKNDEGGYFYEDGINEDAVAALPEGIHIKDDVTRRSENGGVQHTASEKPVGKPKSASQKTTKKVKPEQSVGDLFAGPLDNTSDNGLQGNDDAVRTETVPADNSGQQQGLQESQGSPRKRAEQEGGRPDGGRGGQSTKKDGAVSAGLHGLTEPKNTRNNHSERGADHAPTSVNGRIEANIKAIELAHDLLESGETATPEQMGVLRKFSGWGGLGAAFSDGGNDWKQRERNKKIRELLGEEAYEQAVMSANSAYYTPAYVVDTLWDIANQLGFKGGSILEGSAGIGNILGQMPTAVSERSDIHAIEIDGTSGGILSLLYPDAKVDIQGFEQTRIPNGSVDLAITNVPFVTGLRVNDTTGDSDLSKKFHNIHDFCIAKNVRKLREGGLGIFISSNGTLDNSKALRDWVVNEGGSDFIGAFRMNNKTFGGTTVTSDIIVIRKRVNGQKSAQAIDVSNISGERTADYEEPGARKAKQLSMDYNKYFIEHPDHMAGEMRFAFEEGDTFRPTSKGLYPVSGKDQGKMLADFVKSFTEEERGSAETTESDKPVYVNDASADGKKLGEMYLKDGKLVTAGMGGYYPLEVNDKKIKGHTKQECFNAYAAIKSALVDVMKYQTENEGDAGLQPWIDKLNKAYDAFVSTYGHFTKNNQLAWLRNDVDYPNVFSLEVYKEQGDGKGGVVKTYDKADVMKGRVVEKESEPHPENVKDGVVVSMFKNGRIDVPYIASQLGKSEAEVKREIIDSGLGFEDPTTRQMEVSYQYLSGNVREKLKQAEANNENGEYSKNIKALQDVVPMNIPAHLIDFTLGSSWLDPKLYDEYVKERTDIDVHFTAAGGTWFMKAPTYGVNVEKNRAMGIVSKMLKKTIMGHELISAAIQNKSIIVSRTEKHYDDTTETITDREATAACAVKIDEIRQDFKDWARGKMQSDADLSARMEQEYNDRFNNYVPMSIPDDFVPEYFGGATHKFKMRSHQGKAIVRGTMQPLLLAHEVGTGKTFTLISTAMEMRRLGTARKPMIVVQNATVGQFAASAKELYPNAKILTLEDNDRNAEGRKNFYAKIKYNDWDMIVVPQSTFEFIPDSDERQMQFVQDKIDEKMLVLEKMREADTSGRDPITRRAEKELADLQAEMAALSEDISKKRTANNEKKKAVAKQNAAVKAQEMLDRRTDDVENFDDMGIDALLIDEAHEYKHLGFATAMQRGVKGVDPSYSKKSQGVYLKTQAILEKNNGRNVIFATGTPISNTAAEIWTFMRYLMPKDTMKEYGIYYFDDFVRNFGNIQQMPEFGTNGKFKEVNRFAGYVNLPELVRIWSGVADTVLTKDQKELVKKIPEMEGGKAQDIYLPQTRALRSVMKYVREELDRFDQMSGKEKKENSSIPLTMYGIAQGAAVDARLVEMNAEDDPKSKTNEAVRQTLRSLKETDEYKGTVAIFADHYQNKRSGFNLYEDIKKKLIKQGVPENEIVVMKSGMKIKQKLEIFEKVNRGEVRVILGSTATLGTGVNIQERLHTLIHLDAPNRPMDYTQRNGRILRQGNLHKQWGKPVRVLRFGVEDSLDVTAYQRLKTKGAIADSVMEGDRLMQDSMNNRVLEEEEDVFGDTVAQLSGSEYALLKNNAEKNVRKYESRKKQWEADQTYIHNAKPKLEGQIKAAEQRAEEANAHLLAVQKAFPNGKFTEITVGKQKFGSIEAMADFIKEHNKKVHDAVKEMKKNPGNAKQTSTLTLSLGGYDFVVKTELSRETVNSGGSLFAEIHRKMSYSCPELGLTDMPVKQSLLRNAVEDITENVITGKDFAERFDFATRAVAHGKSELEQLKQREGKPFEFSKELEEAKRQFEEYSEAMKVEMEEKEKKYAEMDASVDAATDVVADDEDEADDGNSKHRMLEDDTPNVIENDSNAMVDRVTELSERLHTPVRIIRTEEEVADLPSARQRRMKGSFNPITGEVTIVVPNNANMTDIENTFVHEVVGHDGLRVLFPDEAKLNNALDELYRVSKDEIRGTIDRMAQKMYDAEVDRLRERKRKEYEAKGEDTNTLYHTDIEKARSEASKKSEQLRRDATEEYAADLAGRIGESGFETMSAEELTFWGKLTTILQKALQKLLDGLKIPGKRKWSDKDWAFVLHEAYKRKKNGGKPTVFDAADTVVMRGKTGFGDTKFSDGKVEENHQVATTIADMKKRVTELFQKAKTGEFVGKPASIGRLSADGKAYLEKLSDLKFKEFVDFVLNPSDLNHIRSDHYGENEKDKGNNVPLTDEDIQNMVDVLNQPDGILYGVDKKDGRKLFFFLKDAGNGLYNLTEVCSTKKGNLTAKSFFKSKKKGISQRVMEIKDSLLPTSVTYSGEFLSSDAKIPTLFEINESSSKNVADGGIMFRNDDIGLEETITKIKVEAAQAAQKATENLNLGGRVVVHESAEGLEGREATAKGWYDTRTGQIHVVLSNNTDAADVTQTILHEAVAHHGLRELFGHNVMDAFLDSVLAAASQEVKDAINELRRGKGWNFRTATEEYLAGLAERTDFERMTAEERGLFATLRRLFNRALEFLGLKNRELSDRELAYILWCSYQNLKTGEKGRYVAEAERIAMRYKLKAGKNAMTDTEKKEHSVLLRGELDNLQEILAKDTYERLVTRGSHLERTAWVDMLSPLQDLQHAIEKNGGFKLGDFENPYNAYITMSSRNYAQMDIYKRTLYADMIEAIHALGSETGRSYEEIKTYVMAKHGMERQKYMAGKAAEEAYDRYKSMHPFGQKTLDYFIDEYEEKSFAGLTELFGTQSVSEAMDEAQKYVEEVEAEAGSLTDSMWDSIRAATKSSLQRAYEAGLISKETYDNVSSMYQYYIPLRGFDEATSDEVYEYFGDQTINGGTGSFMKKAKGRKSVADDPFAVIGNMAEMAIMQSNRNLMKQQLLNLALNHPSDLISVSDLYVKFDEDYDNGDGTRGAWVPVAVPDTSGMTTEEANQVMLDFQDDMEEKVKDEPDTYALAHQKPHIPYRVLGRNMNEHQVMVKRGGKTYILTINANPRAAQAINGLLNPDATENPGAIALKAMTNWIARMATARNVEFAISNAMRDLEFSTTLIPKEGTEYYGRYVKNYLTCVKNIGRLVNRLNGNTLDMSNPLEKAFYDFIYNGGETGYTFMKGVERYKGEITKALSELRAKEGKSKTERLGNKIVYGHHYIINDAWNIYMKGAEYLSRCTEDWVRFAVFLTSRQSGRSMEQSIMDAKEVTVNFNRKGAGSKSAGKWDVSNFFSMNNLHFLSAYAASAFKNFYAFSNASIQGLDKNVRLHLNHTAGMLMWDGAAVTLGMLSAMCIPLMLSAIGGDPDDYWDMPESMRRMGIIIPLGKDGRFLTLPMSIEHRAAYGIGELLGTVVCGSENLPASEITFQAFEQLSQILPLDLTEGNGSMLSLVPTAVRPEVEIAFNKNWLGMPIYKEPFNKNTPAFRNVYQSTNPNYIAMSKWLNEVQGGGDYERAGVQVNPAMVQHLVESYTGGAGKFVSRTSGVIAKIIQGEQIRSNEIPFYRTLVKSVDDRTHNRAARERFQREYDKGQKLIYKIDNYQKESARGNSQYVKELDEFAKSKDFMSYMLWKSYNSVKSQFDNARSYIGDDKDKRAALDHAQMLVQKMMTECARAVEDSKTQEEADEKIGRIQSEYTPQIKETLSKVED
jgi:N12 class adenine-specific DNA methylase